MKTVLFYQQNWANTKVHVFFWKRRWHYVYTWGIQMTFYFCLNGKRRLFVIISLGNAFRRFGSTAGVFSQTGLPMEVAPTLLVRPLLILLATAHFWHQQLNQWYLGMILIWTTFAAFWLYTSETSFPDPCFWPMDPTVKKILTDAGRVTKGFVTNVQNVPWSIR